MQPPSSLLSIVRRVNKVALVSLIQQRLVYPLHLLLGRNQAVFQLRNAGEEGAMDGFVRLIDLEDSMLELDEVDRE